MKELEQFQKKGLSPRTVALLYDTSEGHLANMRSQRRGPRFYRVENKKILYRTEDCDSYFFGSPIQTIDSVKSDANA